MVEKYNDDHRKMDEIKKRFFNVVTSCLPVSNEKIGG